MLEMKDYIRLMEMQRVLGIPGFIAENQAPVGKNGGRSMFKQNRRAQIKRSKRQ